MRHEQAFARFCDPPRQFAPIPFWFWNDDLDEEELLRQVRHFHRAGFGGLLPHPRVGLSRRVGYLTDEYFRLLRGVVAECARLDMKIILYDEASYPSGSACGQVVRENPDFASQAIGLWERELEGPADLFWRPNTGRALLDRPVCTILAQRDAEGRIDPSTLRELEPRPHDIFRLQVPEGSWVALSVWQVQSGGHIRGAHAEEEDGHALAPAAGDLLNPEAVACFVRLTHERYYEHLREHFGSTIIALFTDEPHVFGRGARRLREPRPFTHGFRSWLKARWGQDPGPWLPALWRDYGPHTQDFRRRYAEAVQARLHEVFYRTQSEWCAAHGIALTGHPSGSDEFSPLRYFQIPGQDMVWRWVLPGSPSALEGAHSVAPKGAASAARLAGRKRVLAEVCGAYGWRHSLDEIKWLFDWHLGRGINLLNPHAVFYSLRDRRAWESEPDIGLHNVFWPYFPRLLTYARRLSWLLAAGEHQCQVAVLGDGQALPWAAARRLYQEQIDFLYVDGRAVAESQVQADRLRIGAQAYSALVVDGDPHLEAETRKRLDAFQRAGGLVLTFREGADLSSLPRDLHMAPACADLRFVHYRWEGLDFYVLFNEGEARIQGEVALSSAGKVEAWDPLAGRLLPIEARLETGQVHVQVCLERRESRVLVVDAQKPFKPPPASPALLEERVPVDLEWEVLDDRGLAVDLPAPGDWARHPGWELFTGRLLYRTELELPAAAELLLDLGRVGDIAEVSLDGEPAGALLWAPYVLSLGEPIEPGLHRLEVLVTNTMANEYEGAQCPSGLLGPVHLIVRNPI